MTQNSEIFETKKTLVSPKLIINGQKMNNLYLYFKLFGLLNQLFEILANIIIKLKINIFKYFYFFLKKV